jgi:hypothetical protein
MAIFGKSNTKAKPTGFWEECRFVIELGLISHSSKKEFAVTIESNGGIVDFAISKKVLPPLTTRQNTSTTIYYARKKLKH